MYNARKGLAVVLAVLMLFSVMTVTGIGASAADSKTVIAAFEFDSTNKNPADKLTEYGGKSGYTATSGEGTLVCSVSGSDYRALEWSKAEYGDGADMLPVMSAGNKNPWGSNPYIQITVSTTEYESISVSLVAAGSKKCPANWQLAYSTDGNNFTDIEGANFTITSKTLVTFFEDLVLPTACDDVTELTLRLYATSNILVSGDAMTDPTGGELAINNIIVEGAKIEETPEEATPDETTPDETDPAETTPAETTPDETDPVETTPNETTPAETTPAETTPAETDPVETTPAETTPAETTPAETDPVETTPAETTPAETDPVETTPAETTPAETTPAETTPAETEPATPDEATPDEATPDEATPDEATPDEATPDEATPDEATPDEYILGDANGDGKVNIKDATYIQKYVAGLVSSIDEAAADTDGDGKVTVKDATAIQKHLADIKIKYEIGSTLTRK